MRVSHVRHDVRQALCRNTERCSAEALRRVVLLRAVSALALVTDVRSACLELGVAPATFYRWAARLRANSVNGLEPTSRRPRSPREAWARRAVRERVEKLREGTTTNKDALTALLRREGIHVSASTVGRCIKELVDRGVIDRYAPAGRPRPRRPRPVRPHAVRTPKNLPRSALEPGDIVQVDTLHIEWHEASWRQFSAIDVVSRTAAGQLAARARASDATAFLGHLLTSSPFPIRAIQVDQGAEYRDVFEEACFDLGIVLYENHARTPQQNAYVERLQRTFRDEFYRRILLPYDVNEADTLLQAYLAHYNQVRPHAGLRYLTPAEYLQMREPLVRLT